MPNIWTHILFCEDITASLGLTDNVLNYEAYIKLGAQGPDPFFYYNFWPWINETTVQQIGTALHTKHCGRFLIDLINEAKRMPPSIQAYVFGFVTHHILDRNAHPYIHYRAGYEGNDHQRLEVQIDTLMMQRYRGRKTWKEPVHTEIDVGKTLDSALTELLYATIQKHYPAINPPNIAYIHKAYRDMKLALRILSDPYGWKNKLLASLISAYSHQPITTDTDYLNEQEQTWYHPATKEPSNETFIDLYQTGLSEALEIAPLLLDYWRGNNEDSALQQVIERIGDISYDTGKPLSLNLKNQYSDPII